MMRPVLILGVVAVGGCGGAAPSETRPEAAAPAPPAASSGEEEVQQEPPDPTAGEHMRHHFGMVAAARDAVIRGDLEAVRRPLGSLYDGDYGIEIPQEWMSSLKDMQQEARRGSQARDLDDAGRAVAMVSKQCGDCHGSFGRPEHVARSEALQVQAGGVEGAMALHKWAAEQMWLGLVVPSHEAWIRGSDAISERWSPLPDDEHAEPDVGALIEAIRAMGPALREAQTPLSRAEAYGRLIADCGGCHVAMGVQPSR